MGLAAVLGGCGEPTLQERAEQGDAQAQYELGLTLDYDQAAKWFRKAAEQGHADAQFFVGIRHRSDYRAGRGKGGYALAQTIRWFRKAAEQGHKDAIEALEDLGYEWEIE